MKVQLIEEIIFAESIHLLLEIGENDRRVIDKIKKILKKKRLLSFSVGNAKLGDNILIFSLPAGWTCPFGETCKVLVDRAGGNKNLAEKIEHLCYAAWEELIRPTVRASRWRNLDLLDETKNHEEIVDLIYDSIKYHIRKSGTDVEYVRIHESGDFYDGRYLFAWIDVAKKMPYLEFYAYTKSLPFVKKHKNLIDDVDNFKINISAGSAHPELEGILNYPVVDVFQTPEEVLKAGQLIDLDDSIAYNKENVKDFALLIHGQQTLDLGIPDLTKDTVRNTVFMKYYKNKNELNDYFDLDSNHKITNDEAKKFVDDINMYVKEKEINPNEGIEVIKLLKNVIKFNNYNFSDELINIIPPKFR